jgi:hypothetical protein
VAVRHVEGVGGPPGQRYLSDLKPIIATGAEVRGEWMTMLARLNRADDPSSMQREAVQAGLDRSQNFRELRRRLATLRPPPELTDMHRSVDGWLAAMIGSCDAIVQHAGPLGPEQLDRVRERLRRAAKEAERFNTERRALAGEPAARLPTFRLRPKTIAAIAGALLLGSVAYVGLGGPGSTTVTDMIGLTGRSTAGRGALGAGVERRVFPQAEILARLRQEIAGRSVQFQDVDVQLEPPDRVVVPGRVLAPGGSQVAVTVELRVGAEDGRPKITPIRIGANGLSVPQAFTEALARRADEANRELANHVPAGQIVRRVYVENNAVVAEVEAAAPAATGTGAPAPSKP